MSLFLLLVSEPSGGDQSLTETVQIQQGASVYPTSQYVEGNSEPSIYPTTNGQM